MKNYVKPELDIVEFQLNDIVAVSDPFDPFDPGWDMSDTDEIFVGEEEGYVV